MDSETTKNHYVPRFYLKTFFDKSGKIHIKNIENSEVTSHNKNELDRIAMTKNLYTVTNKITSQDVELFKNVFIRPSKVNGKLFYDEIAGSYIDSLAMYLNGELSGLMTLGVKKEKLDKESRAYYEHIVNILGDYIKSKADTKGVSRSQENLFTFYESEFLPLYKKMLSGDSVFDIQEKLNINLPDDDDFEMYRFLKFHQWALKQLVYKVSSSSEEYIKLKKRVKRAKVVRSIRRYDFIHYIISQYSRTLKRISNLHDNLDGDFEVEFKSRGIDKENFTFLSIHFLSILIAQNLIASNYKIISIINKSDEDFISSDCPCVNIYASFDSIKKQERGRFNENELEIYFPLSPRLAILYSNKDCYKKVSEFVLRDVTDVDAYNNVIIQTAQSVLFSNSKETLNKY